VDTLVPLKGQAAPRHSLHLQSREEHRGCGGGHLSEDSPVKEFTQDSSQGHSDSSFYEEEEEKKSSDKEKEIIFANIAKTRSRVDDKQEELL
jgi:hypothetical protein